MTRVTRFALVAGIAVVGAVSLAGCASQPRAAWLVRRDANHPHETAQTERRDLADERAYPTFSGVEQTHNGESTGSNSPPK